MWLTVGAVRKIIILSGFTDKLGETCEPGLGVEDSEVQL